MFKVLRNGLLRYILHTCPNLWCNSLFKVLRNGLLRYILHTCPNLWCNSCSNCYGMDCFGTCFKIVQSCNVIISLVRHISRYSSISLVINITILYSPSFCARSWCFICILWWKKRPRRIDPKVPYHPGTPQVGHPQPPVERLAPQRRGIFWDPTGWVPLEEYLTSWWFKPWPFWDGEFTWPFLRGYCKWPPTFGDQKVTAWIT